MNFEPAVKAAQKGSQEAFGFLYEQTYQDKYYIALKYMKNDADAQDVLQDAYVKAFRSIGKLSNPKAFSSWLGTIVANTAKTALGKNKALTFSDLNQEDEDGNDMIYDIEDDRMEYRPEEQYTSKETQELARELLDSLSDEQRICVVMFHLEGLSLKEIASTCECSENTVKSRLNYGRKAIGKKALELKKQGCKIYSTAPIPLLLYLFGLEKNSTEVMAAAKAAQTASKVTASTGKVAATKITTGKIATGKIVAGAIGICVIGTGIGGTIGTLQKRRQSAKVEVATTSVATTQATTEQQNTKEELRIVYNKLLDQLAGTYQYYAVYDINQDGIPEVMVGKEDGSAITYHTYTARVRKNGYEAKGLSGEFSLGTIGKVGVGSLHAKEKGSGILIRTVQGGTGEESVYQLTMKESTITQGTNSIMNFKMQSSEEEDFLEKNKVIESKEISDRSLLKLF